ncbi:MAG: polyketide cyclase [Anaerolineae bacterium]|nr:polyketide cyclase [Anaerolineae bacterium]
MQTSIQTSASNDYQFITNWRVFGTLKEVTDIIGDAERLPIWWPSVYLEVKVLEPGDSRGLGKVVDLYTKGWLPYTLRWRFTVTEVSERGFRIEAEGDFVGYGVWTFEQDGDWVNVKYEWVVRADKPLLRDLSFLMKPIFSANHHWAMRKGEESLQLELARQRAKTPHEKALIPAPPPPTTSSPIPLAVASLVAAFLGWRVIRVIFR